MKFEQLYKKKYANALTLNESNEVDGILLIIIYEEDFGVVN